MEKKKEKKEVKTSKELTKDFNNTKLGKKCYTPVLIFTIILVIAFIPYLYSIIDELFEINALSKDTVFIINRIFDIALLVSLVFDAYYYGALEQYKIDRTESNK